jgi:hypothetical protein
MSFGEMIPISAQVPGVPDDASVGRATLTAVSEAVSTGSPALESHPSSNVAPAGVSPPTGAPLFVQIPAVAHSGESAARVDLLL